MNPLHYLEDPLRALLDFLHENLNLTYGWSIVVLTVLVRMVLLPLVVRQYKSMRRMAEVAPQLKELQRKHKGNRQKLQEEMMAFYKENQINPFSSCLPIVPQIPVFIALYYVLKQFARDATDGTDLSFLWVFGDITKQLNELGWTAAIIVVVYGSSQLLSTELSTTPNMPDAQRRIMRVLPLVIVLFVFQFPVPSGLVLYWCTTNLWTGAQQLVMRHRIGLHLPETVEAGKRGSRATPPVPVPVAAAVGATDEAAAPAGPGTPRKRRRRSESPAPAEPEAPELEPEAPELEPEAPEAQAQGDPEAEAAGPEETGAGDEEPPAAPEPAAPRTGSGGGGSSGRAGGKRPPNRRQPRAGGTSKGSRPAPKRRSPKKRR